MLVIDEYAPSRIATCIALAIRGHICTHVATEPEAVGAIVTFRPDAIVYECHRRDQPARGMSHRLRQVAEVFATNVMVIAMSVLGEPGSFRETDAVDAYLTKPFEAAELDRVLRR